ncbi:MAG: hypothetical protein D6692_10420 [Planctomycetota bacterium]|nr:MAG: hypothetical protein D6692_10420 [Planctomycetota bacterium]
MPLTPPQLDRIARSFALIADRPEDLRSSFDAEMARRGATCPRPSARIVAELLDIASTAARTDGAAFMRDSADRASWGAEEHALLAAVADLCDYAWTRRLENDWAVLVACAVERAMASRVAA